jgi:hypothetical protein
MIKISRVAGIAALLALAGCNAAAQHHASSTTQPPPPPLPALTVPTTPGPAALPDAAEITPICTTLGNQGAALLQQAQNGSVTLGLLKTDYQYLAYNAAHGPKLLRGGLKSAAQGLLDAVHAFEQGGAAAVSQFEETDNSSNALTGECTGYGSLAEPPGGQVGG